MNENVQRLQTQISTIRGDLAILEETRDELLARLAADPGDAETVEQLDVLESRDIASRTRQIARLEDMITAAQKIDEKALRAAEKQRKQAVHDEYVDLIERRADLTQELVEAWPAIVSLLQEIGELSTAAHAAGIEVGEVPITQGDRFLHGVAGHLAKTMLEAGLDGNRLEYITPHYSPFMRDWRPVTISARENAAEARARRDALRGGAR